MPSPSCILTTDPIATSMSRRGDILPLERYCNIFNATHGTTVSLKTLPAQTMSRMNKGVRKTEKNIPGNQ